MIKKVLFILSFFCSFQSINAQCQPGEVELWMNVFVDPWGEETYWEITPGGAGCGNQTVGFGSNAEEVGCALGLAVTGNYGYPDNSLQVEGSFCLTAGEPYDLYFYDSFGDGGLVFELYQDGLFTNLFYGQGSGNMLTFIAGENNLPAYDSPCGAVTVLPDGPAVLLNNQNAVTQYGEIHPTGDNCSVYGMWCEQGVSNSVWAKFVADGNKNYEISLCNEGTNFDTQIAVWKADPCDSWNGYHLVSSNDDSWDGCANWASTCFAGCLEAGATYYVQIDGWNGSVGDASLTVTTYNGDVTLSAVVNDVPCPIEKGQTSNGSILPSIYGMSADFDCEWIGPDGYNSDDHFVFQLGPGVYTLVATDDCGAEYYGQYEISNPESWLVSLSLTNSTCPGSPDGVVEAEAEGATGPYTYSWFGPGNFSGQDNPMEGLYAGDYDLTITDSFGCLYQQSFLLGTGDGFSFDLGEDTTVCVFEEFIVSAPPGLNYLWQDGSTNQFFEVIAAEWGEGVHALVLSASTEDGCVDTDAFIFTVEICGSIADINASLEWSLFPNPNNGHFEIQSNYAGKVELRLFDLTGRNVLEFSAPSGRKVEMNANLAPGLYTLQLIANGSNYTKPFVIE